MSFIYERPQVSEGLTFADGIATTGELYRAARDAAIYADNFVARDAAIEEAYDRRADAIFKATGQRVTNPMREIEAEQRGHAAPVAAQRWQQQLIHLQAQYPQFAREIRAQVPIIEDAKLVAREAGNQFDAAVGSRDDFAGKWATILGGGFTGALRDPVQVASLFLGAGTGAARSITGRILQTAAREAVLNGALEAAQQPMVQAWRKEAGLPAGFDEALRNTAMATAFAGLLGAGSRGLHELAGNAMKTLPPENLLRQAEDGNGNAAASVLSPIADTLAPEARGAIQAAEADQALTVSRPAGVDAETHDRNIAAGIRAAEDEGPITTIEVKDKRQGTLKRPMNVMEFIASIGGLRDDDGELAARGLSIRSSMTRHGPAVRKKGEVVEEGGLFGAVTQARKGKGLSADEVRERLVEAGYLDDAGDVTGGNARTAATDVFELIDRHLAGEKVVARGDEGWQLSVDEAAMKRRNDFELEKYGDDADRASRFGIAITEEAIAMRSAGIGWNDADLEFAADWHNKFPHESPRTAIEEAMVRRLYEQEKAAREIEPVQEDDFWVQHKPPKDWNDEPGENIRLDDSGDTLPAAGRAGDGQPSEGALPGQRGPGGSDGQEAGSEPGLNPAIAALTKDSEIFEDPLQWADFAAKDPEKARTLLDDVLRRVREVERSLAKKYKVKLADLEDAPLTKQETDFLFHSNVPDAEIGRDLQRIIEPVTTLDDAATEMSYALKGIKAAGEITPSEKLAMARLNYLHSEVSRLGGDPLAQLKTAVEKFATRIDDPEDQLFLAQSVMKRISDGMSDTPAPPSALRGGKQLLLNNTPSKPEGGIDDPTAPETAAMADAMLATVKRDQEEMAREIYGEFPGRAAGWHSVADLMEDAERPQHLSALVEACKAV